jgi:hypothetical protein
LDEAIVVRAEADCWTGCGEIEEFLGVDLGEFQGSPLVEEEVDRGGCCVPGIVPALKRGKHDGLFEFRFGTPLQVSHPRYAIDEAT